MSFRHLSFVLAGLLVCIPSITAPAELTVDFDAPRGIVASKAEAALSTDLAARIARLPFSEGQRFSAGDTLVEFDCQRYRAELEAAEAEETVARLGVQENKELRKHRAVGLNEYEVSVARHLKAKAGVKALAARVAQCSIAAPFDGRIVSRLANEFEIPRANEPILKIVDDKRLEIELIVPSAWLAWLSEKAAFEFHIDETRQKYEGRVAAIGAIVDPVSQTVRVTGTFLAPPTDVLPGMSGSAYFDDHLKRARSAVEN